MKRPQKLSRNRQRKAAYVAKASGASRNQSTIAGPLVGHFETVSEETRVRRDRDTGEVLYTYTVPVKPYERIVHDEPSLKNVK